MTPLQIIVGIVLIVLLILWIIRDIGRIADDVMDGIINGPYRRHNYKHTERNAGACTRANGDRSRTKSNNS